MINLAIVGYGNLGKALESLVLEDKSINLVGIFSRREVNSKYKTPCYPLNKLEEYLTIDILALCGGSNSDLLTQSPHYLKKYDIINSFDTHSKIKDQHLLLNKISKQSKKVAIICCGWDPGLFSLLRILLNSISSSTKTYWGKGVSMGHTNALKNIPNVKNAVALTLPNQQKQTHMRKLYIVANKEHHKQIIRDIKNNKSYFSDFPIDIQFVGEKEIKKYITKKHAGLVETNFKLKNHNNQIKFYVKMTSNPYFTANIMKTYIKIKEKVKNNLGYGAYTLAEIPISLLNDDYINYV